MHVLNLAALFTLLATFTATAAAADQGSYQSPHRYKQAKSWMQKEEPIREGKEEKTGHRRGDAYYFTSGSPSVVAEDKTAKNAPSRFEQWKAEQKQSEERNQERGINGIRRVETYYP